MFHVAFLQDLAIVMAVSAGIMVICHIIRLPVVFGYIMAGIIIGPNTPPFPLISDINSIYTLSDLGVIFLLFFIGLQFSLKKLAKVGFVSFVAANMEILLMLWIGISIGRFLGWKFMDSLFLGAILSISSSTIIAKMLFEMKKIPEKFAQIILGIVVIDDILAIVVLAVLSGLASTGTVTFDDAGLAMLRVLTFIAGILLAGFLLIPRLLKYLARFQTSEVMVVSVLGLCFASSLLAAKLGFSVGLGAFLIGTIIAETQHGENIARLMEPLRDMFTAIFFVSVGMLFEPALVLDAWLPILFITVAAILGRVFSCSLATFLAGNKPETALRVGLGLAPIGEFSFIIARLGQTLQVTSPFLYSVAVSVSGLTTIVSPFLVRHTDSIVRFLGRFTPKPLANFAGLYLGLAGKIGRLGLRFETTPEVWRGIKGYFLKLVFYALGGFIVFFLVSNLVCPFFSFSDTACWILIGIAMFPVLAGFAYTLDGFLWNVFFLNAVNSPEVRQSIEANPILHHVFRFCMILLAGLLFLFVASFLTHAVPLLASMLGLLVIAGFLLWGAVKNVYNRIEGLVLGIFDPDVRVEQKSAAHDELVKLIHEQYPWEVETLDFLVPLARTTLNATIRDLHLRSETGASIVAIYRDTESIPNPSPDTVIQPGDVLLLMGDHDQIMRAVQFLQRKIKEPQKAPGGDRPETRRFTIPAGSRLLGRKIRDIHVRRNTQVTILGLQKGDVTINNPDSETILGAGDILILFGTRDQVEKAVSYLEAEARGL